MKFFILILILLTGCASEIWRFECWYDVYDNDATGAYQYSGNEVHYYWDEPKSDEKCYDYVDKYNNLHICQDEWCKQTQHQ